MERSRPGTKTRTRTRTTAVPGGHSQASGPGRVRSRVHSRTSQLGRPGRPPSACLSLQLLMDVPAHPRSARSPARLRGEDVQRPRPCQGPCPPLGPAGAAHTLAGTRKRRPRWAHTATPTRGGWGAARIAAPALPRVPWGGGQRGQRPGGQRGLAPLPRGQEPLAGDSAARMVSLWLYFHLLWSENRVRLVVATASAMGASLPRPPWVLSPAYKQTV